MMRNQSLADAMRSRLDSEKAEAKIEYQTGFAPPAPAGLRVLRAKPQPQTR
jgi:hypothetical protein